jgi:quinol monooxygenase YgiN
MIHAIVTITANSVQRQGLLDVLRSLLNPTRVEPGCLDCRLFEDVTTEGVLTLVEDWATPTDFERHLRSENYRLLLMAIELSAVPPEVRFHEVSSTLGIEAIHAARGR